MKNYRLLTAFLLVILMAASIYSMVTGAISKQKKVDELLIQAFHEAQQALYDKAAACYSDVISLDNDISYYIAAADMYYEAGQYDMSKSWCDKMLTVFPNRAESYERMLRVYLQTESYSDAYTTLNEFDGRKLSSDIMEEYRDQMKYLYYTDSVSYDFVTKESSGYVGIEIKGLWGLATVKGANKVSPKFEEMGYFANSMVAVVDSGNWYFINSEGEYLYNISGSVDGVVTDVGLYNNELVPICVDGIYSYYNLEFQKQFGEYDYAGAFSSGIAAVKKGDQWQLINTNGSFVTSDEYMDVVIDERGVCCQEERIFALVSENEYIMLDTSGERIGQEVFEGAKLFSGDGYAAIMVDELWGYADLSGNIVIEPKYDDAKSYSLGIAAVCNDDLWGYADIEGNLIIESRYTDCLNFSSAGTAFAQQGDNWEIIKLYQYNY